MKRLFTYAGSLACGIAILAMSGGHWLALQSWAWARMMVEFSRTESLRVAVVKTFDGRHPCLRCVQVQEGWKREQQQEKKQPLLRLEKMPEPVWQLRQLTLPPVQITATDPVPFVPRFHSEFTESPPKPPPRPGVGAAA